MWPEQVWAKQGQNLKQQAHAGKLTWLQILRSRVQCQSLPLPQQSVSAARGDLERCVSARCCATKLPNLDKQVIKLLQNKLPEGGTYTGRQTGRCNEHSLMSAQIDSYPSQVAVHCFRTLHVPVFSSNSLVAALQQCRAQEERNKPTSTTSASDSPTLGSTLRCLNTCSSKGVTNLGTAITMARTRPGECMTSEASLAKASSMSEEPVLYSRLP